MERLTSNTEFVDEYINRLEVPIFRQKIQSEIGGRLEFSDFSVDPDVFISPFDNLGTWDFLSKEARGKRVLDMGSGTGCLSLAAAKFGAYEVTSFEIIEAALFNTQQNITKSRFQDRIQIFRSDLFATAEKLHVKNWDIIIANLPFDNCSYKTKNGMNIATRDQDFVINRSFLKNAKNYLAPKGKIVFNHSNFSGACDLLVAEIVKNEYFISQLSENAIPFGRINRKFFTMVLESQIQQPNLLKNPKELYEWQRKMIQSDQYLRQIDEDFQNLG